MIIPSILLVDDDEIDVELIERSFHKYQLMNPIVNAPNGIVALDMIRGNHEKVIDKPYIILLDINMPQMNGLEFLRKLRSDETIAKNVVFMLTTSNNTKDREEAYANHVAGYIQKEKAGEDFLKVIHLLKNYQEVITFPE